MKFQKDAMVKHPKYGNGKVRMDDGESIIVRFDHGVEECFSKELELIESLDKRTASLKIDPALNVITRILGNCILSVNDSWGVFSCSKIALLPHQLWVCKRVLESWPTRWLIADDVGLGKTIEAGLILTPLISSGRVKRLLIIAPASIVDQWQIRLNEMFDIGVSIYSPSIDKDKSDYWNRHNMVVASSHTLRKNINGRWNRLLGSKPWDLLLIDEAHHMNVDKKLGRTLAYKIVELLQAHKKISSMVFFTGTPHRGKDFGFLSLLKLLKPNEFDPHTPLENQVHKLRNIMIRNNKQRVTDMKGKPLFTPVRSYRETYTYSHDETIFYEKLTEFISTGKAYAANLKQQQQKTAILVLITMQKLASSSVAAVKRAIAKRLERLQSAKSTINKVSLDLEKIKELQNEDDPSNFDEISRLEEKITENLDDSIYLNPNEIPALKELLVFANAVNHETKIMRILDVIDSHFSSQSVLIFTEYKATQALLMSELLTRYGEECVTFINGDGYIEGVKNIQGNEINFKENRHQAANKFNRGKIRFLVSTEAAGEGIDLQGNCSALIHADLPWNPMRLHQRVGRLSRYGQKRQVDVVSVRNNDTVESRIWECLDKKIDRITLAFQGAMDYPEDMRQLVIGMTSPRLFTQIFADAEPKLKGQRLDEWFNSETASFGGKDAVETVKNMFGNIPRFDFSEFANKVPKVNLPDLLPFLKALLAIMGKRPNQIDKIRLKFKTPKQWMDDFTIADHYNLLFDRNPHPQKKEDIAGVGLKVINRAICDAVDLPESLSVIKDLKGPLIIFLLRDRITGTEGAVKKIIVGLQLLENGVWELLKDWQVIILLNPFADKPRSQMLGDTPDMEIEITSLLDQAKKSLKLLLKELDIPFQLPTIETLACLIPGKQIIRKTT